MISGVSIMQMELRCLFSVGSPEANEIDSSERRALFYFSECSSPAECWAHNPKAAGSIPALATNFCALAHGANNALDFLLLILALAGLRARLFFELRRFAACWSLSDFLLTVWGYLQAAIRVTRPATFVRSSICSASLLGRAI